MDSQDMEYKLTLLLLIDKMDLPLSEHQITDCLQPTEPMEQFTLMQTLSEMVEMGYLDSAKDNNITKYTITGEGLQTLEMFEKRIPLTIRNKINQYIRDNHKEIKRSFENTAIFFPNAENDEFVVKCGVYEESRVLMELTISVDTREQARLIQNNWKANAKTLYGDIIMALAKG